MHYVGAIDEPGQNPISGWAVSQFGDICRVTATVNGQVFSVSSDRPRPDLAAKQQSRGAGGFRIDVASALVPGPNQIDITFPDGRHLPGSPIARILPADWVAPAAAPAPAPPAPPRAPPVLTLAPEVPRLTLAELEDISLDDVSHAVAHGIIKVRTPPMPAPVTRAEPIAPTTTVAPPPAVGWLSRLLRRRPGSRHSRAVSS
jgi:hypothetical protein